MRVKIQFFGLLSVIVVMGITSLILVQTAFIFSDKSEDIDFQQNFARVDVMIDSTSEAMTRTAMDWATWDDTYQFVFDQNFDYIDTNLKKSTLVSLDLNYMVFLDERQNVVFELENRTEGLPPFSQSLSLERLISPNFTPDYEDVTLIKTGFLRSGDRLFQVSVAPITTSNGFARRNGTLILARIMDETFIEYLNRATQEKIDLLHTEVSYLFAPAETDWMRYSSLDKDLSIVTLNDTSTGLKLYPDIFGQYNIPIYMTIDRHSVQNGKGYLFHFIGVFALVILLTIWADVVIFDQYYINRINKLHDFVGKVAEQKDPEMRIEISGNDEIADLARSTNAMLMAIDQANQEIKVMDERFRLVLESTNDGFIDYDLVTGELYTSPQWMKFMGIQSPIQIKSMKDYAQLIHPDYFPRMSAYFDYFIHSIDETFQQEYKMRRMNGGTVWVLHRGKVISRDENGMPVRILSTLSDITSRKKYEEEILLFSYSDKLTGLTNRAYIDKVLEDLSQKKETNYSIIMGDLNGLKLANDAFGHKEGDRMLVYVADILKLACEPDDIISRWGGDELIIVVVGKSSSYVSNLIERIKEFCDRFNGLPLKLSIALGSADNAPDNNDVETTLQLAEERMYRNKLMESKSARSAIILTLERSLSEKHNETEDHTQRIRDLCLQVGEQLNLSHEKMDELSLLAALHDIGKIGIPDRILTKPGKLTSEEWEIMKGHTEIGYRIAASTPELAYIADAILHHHERFDGTGYPHRLKGKNIPLISRILNIVDSFDVMTHKRCYKEAVSLEEAIVELRRCSGNQFDPELVEIFIRLLEEERIALEV